MELPDVRPGEVVAEAHVGDVRSEEPRALGSIRDVDALDECGSTSCSASEEWALRVHPDERSSCSASCNASEGADSPSTSCHASEGVGS